MIEKKVYSQNNEDGIFEYLINFIHKKTFLEIGWGDGSENNCKNLLVQHNFTGTGIDTKDNKFNHKNLKFVKKRLDENDANFIIQQEGKEPGVFSLDIDSIDYHLLKNLINKDFRPMILCHEYNSVWGPTKSFIRKLNVKYEKKFLYGASLTAYKKLLKPFYNFITVESTGVNAFYIRKDIEFIMPNNTLDFAFLQKWHTKKLSEIELDDGWLEV